MLTNLIDVICISWFNFAFLMVINEVQRPFVLLNLISLFCESGLLPFSGKKSFERVLVEFLYILEMDPFLAVGIVNTFFQYITRLVTVKGDFL